MKLLSNCFRKCLIIVLSFPQAYGGKVNFFIYSIYVLDRLTEVTPSEYVWMPQHFEYLACPRTKMKLYCFQM